jgi:hypothetical protein
MIRKSDNSIVAYMSTETTAENMLGNASAADYEVIQVEDSMVKGQPIVGATVTLVGTPAATVTASAEVSPPTDYKAIYAAAKADSERIAIIAQKLGLI